MTEGLRDRVRAAVERRVTVDVRAVAALRVSLAVLLVVDYLSRARWLRAAGRVAVVGLLVCVGVWNGLALGVADAPDGDGDAHPPPASTARPTPAFDTVRWRKYLTAVAGTRDPALERALAAGLCRRWNRSHGTRLRRLSVVVVTEPVAGDERRRREIASGACPTAVSSRRPVPSSRRPRRTPRAAGPPPGR